MKFKYVSKSLLLQAQRQAGQEKGGATDDEEEDRGSQEEGHLFCSVREGEIG